MSEAKKSPEPSLQDAAAPAPGDIKRVVESQSATFALTKQGTIWQVPLGVLLVDAADDDDAGEPAEKAEISVVAAEEKDGTWQKLAGEFIDVVCTGESLVGIMDTGDVLTWSLDDSGRVDETQHWTKRITEDSSPLGVLARVSPLAAAQHQGIRIDIVASADKSACKVKYSGFTQRYCTWDDMKEFKIQDAALKEAIRAYAGKAPTRAYFKDPTHTWNLYKTYNWKRMEVKLEPYSAQIVRIDYQPAVVAEKEFVNDHPTVTVVHSGGVNTSVTRTTEHNWTKNHSISVDQKIEYGINFIIKAKGETSFGYSHSWGKGGSESTSIAVGSDLNVSVPLAPGEKLKALLTMSRGTMKVRVKYRAYLLGQTAVHYHGRYKAPWATKKKGHAFYALPIAGVMQKGNIPRFLYSEEVIDVGFYTKAKIETAKID